jgi:hypothetical protein
MRAILRVIEILHRAPDVDQNAKFMDFFKSQVSENSNVNALYEKIVATAS